MAASNSCCVLFKEPRVAVDHCMWPINSSPTFSWRLNHAGSASCLGFPPLPPLGVPPLPVVLLPPAAGLPLVILLSAVWVVLSSSASASLSSAVSASSSCMCSPKVFLRSPMTAAERAASEKMPSAPAPRFCISCWAASSLPTAEVLEKLAFCRNLDSILLTTSWSAFLTCSP